MHNSNTYILQLYVKKCKINVSEAGSVGLLLRAGKNQSHVTNLQPIINGVVNFNTLIKINVDDSALDTKRCTLTLNFVSTSSSKRIIGIVVITIPEIGTETEKALKITSTPDKDAQIQLIIGLKGLHDNNKIPSQPSRNLKPIPIKQTQKPKTVQPSKINTSPNSMITSLTSKNQQTPTSPPSQTNQKLNLKSKRSQIESISGIQHSEESIIIIERLQKEKEFLKQLLKVEMVKSATACNHLKNILELLQNGIGIGVGVGDALRMTTGGVDLGLGKKFSVDSLDLKSGLSLSTPGLSVVKESRFEDISPAGSNKYNKSPCKSKQDISLISKSLGVTEIIKQLKGSLEQVGKSKTQLTQIFDKIKLEPKIEIDAPKLRVLKTRIDKVYIPLIAKDKITKEEILKQKIEINRILDEVICPLVK